MLHKQNCILLLFHEKFHLEYIYPDGEYSAEDQATGRKKLPIKPTIIGRKRFGSTTDCRVGTRA